MKRKHSQASLLDYFLLPKITRRNIAKIQEIDNSEEISDIFPDINKRIIDPREIVYEIEARGIGLHPIFYQEEIDILAERHKILLNNTKNAVIRKTII